MEPMDTISPPPDEAIQRLGLTREFADRLRDLADEGPTKEIADLLLRLAEDEE